MATTISGTSLSVPGNITSSGNISTTNNGNITSSGNISTTNNGNITSAGDVTVTNDVTSSGNITLDSDLIFTNRVSTDGHIKLWNGDDAGGYAIGIEAGTLYNRSNQNHRWYLSSYADGGTSDYMELTTTGLDVPSGTIQDTTGNVRTPRSIAISATPASPISDEGVYYCTNAPTITLGSPAAGAVMTFYNNSTNPMTLNRGSTISTMRIAGDNNTTNKSSVTLGPVSTTTVTVWRTWLCGVLGTDVS